MSLFEKYPRTINPVPKPSKTSKRQRRQAAISRRRLHYGGSSDWPALKLAVFRRDQWRCVNCGADHLRTGIALEAHHLDNVGMGGRVSADIDRIVSLCPQCHRLVDTGKLTKEILAAKLTVAKR